MALSNFHSPDRFFFLFRSLTRNQMWAVAWETNLKEWQLCLKTLKDLRWACCLSSVFGTHPKCVCCPGNKQDTDGMFNMISAPSQHIALTILLTEGGLLTKECLMAISAEEKQRTKTAVNFWFYFDQFVRLHINWFFGET